MMGGCDEKVLLLPRNGRGEKKRKEKVTRILKFSNPEAALVTDV